MVELFFLTKRSIEKAMYYWGNFSDKEIFELMLQLVELELRGCFRLHIVWVVGRMQIAAGKDDFFKGLFDRWDSLVWIYFRLSDI